MKQSDFPSKIVIPFAGNASNSFVRDIPQTTTDQTAASFDQGFPADTFTATVAGGTPPDGKDFNGILRIVTGLLRQYCLGYVPQFDAAYQTAVGGYPNGCIVQDATMAGIYWQSTADANTTTPGASGSSWVRAGFYKATSSTLIQTSNTGNMIVPAGVYLMRFRLRAGGGGGGAGGGNSTSAVSAGGGGGGWIEVIIAVKPGNNVSWVVGAGGSAGVNNGTSGTSGGDTILYVSGVEVARVTGGSGGANATEGSVGAGGVGGTSKVTTAVGYAAEDGAGGGYGIYAGVSQGWGGTGGPSFGKSFVQVTGQNTTGITGQSGGGGSGGTGTSNSGAGTAGEVIYDF